MPPPPEHPRRLTFEEKVAKDMQYVRLRLRKLQERFASRAELLERVEREVDVKAQQYARKTAAALEKASADRQQKQQQSKGAG